MATNTSFNDMLNEYLAIDLLSSELIKRDYFFTKVDKDQGWKGGTLPVPFKGAQASSVKFGGLTNQADVSEYDYVRGQISAQQEVWGTLKFNQTDLIRHDGSVNEKSFLKMLPDQIEEFMEHMKMAVAINMLSGPHFATVIADGSAASGILGVDKIDRFELGQKVVIKDNNSPQLALYVVAIDINAKTITVSLTRGGAAADVSAYSVAQAAKLYHDGVMVGGVVTNTFTSLRSALLSAANGGSAQLYGVTKTAYPYTQAVNISGASISASNILDKLFDAYTEVRTRARGNANTILMSYKHLGSVMKLIESQKGAFKTTATATKASLYGWTEIEITSVKGPLTIVGIQEMDDDIVIFVDWKAMKFFSNGLFRKRIAPDGKQYYEVREESGFYYLHDVCLYGELVVHKPSNCGIIHSIPNY